MIVITARTSRIGSQLLGQLVGRAELRVVARDPSRLPKQVRDHADVITGSHSDPDPQHVPAQEYQTIMTGCGVRSGKAWDVNVAASGTTWAGMHLRG